MYESEKKLIFETCICKERSMNINCTTGLYIISLQKLQINIKLYSSFSTASWSN
jgi:hypothetical protein